MPIEHLQDFGTSESRVWDMAMKRQPRETFEATYLVTQFAGEEDLEKIGDVRMITGPFRAVLDGDILVMINAEVWRSASEDLRIGILDHLFSLVEAEENGKGEIKYKKHKPPCGFSPHVIARNPALVEHLKSVQKMRAAVDKAQQMMLPLGAEQESEERPAAN